MLSSVFLMDDVFTNPLLVDTIAGYVRDFRVGASIATLQRVWPLDFQIQIYLRQVRADAEAIVDHEIRLNERAFQVFLERRERERTL